MQPEALAGDAPSLLIVDDSAVMRAMIRRAASLSGVPIGAVYEAADGRAALDVLEHHAVRIVFTDVNMPVMTGTELLRAMQARDDWRDIVRVVISTDGSQSRRDEAQDLDARLYVEKPFRPEVMRDVLSTLVTVRPGH